MRKITIMLVCLLFAAQAAFAQKKVTGSVTSAEDGSGIPGVTVLVKGTTLGTTTNVNGQYEIVAQPTATLVFSVVGMKSIEVAVGDRSVINIIMEIDVYAIEELVVVGYGVQQRRDVAGSISTVRGDAIKTIPVQSFDQALQGKAVGVNITIPNAVLGNPPVIRIRGVNSISGSSNPLVVVDGIPVFDGNLSRNAAPLNVLGDINPADIASIEILKDASASAIYGSRAANGVILITTKSGEQGKTKVTYDASFGYSQAYRLYDLMNAEQFIAHKNLAMDNGLWPLTITSGGTTYNTRYALLYDANGWPINTNWNDIVYQTGFQHSQTIGVSGASSNTKYFLSLNYSNNDGIVKTNSYERKSARMNLEHKLTKHVTIGTNVSYTDAFTNAPQTGSLEGALFATAGAGRLAFVTAPIVSPYLNNGKYNIDAGSGFIGTIDPLQWNGVGFFNPVFLFDNNYNNAKSDRVLATTFVNINLYKGLYFKTIFGIDNSAIETKTFWHPDHGDGRTTGGNAFNYFDRRNRWNWTNTLNYSTTFVDKINLTTLLGTEEQHTTFDGWSASRNNIADPFYSNFQGYFVTDQAPPTLLKSENYFLSYFGRINLNYDRKYYVEFSGRRDGFSGLAKGNKYGNFGGVSFMWNVSRESFFNSLNSYVSDLRLKASMGKVGNISGLSNYGSLFLYSASRYNNNSTFAFSQAGNPDLAWEASDKFDIGVAFGILGDRIQFDFNYFDNQVNDLILNVPQSPSKGIPGNEIPQNIGSMYNKGIEISVTSYNINKNDFKWNTIFNFATLKNEVTELAPGVEYLLGQSHLEFTNRTVVGQPIGVIWGIETAGVDKETGRRIFIRRNADKTTSKVYYLHPTSYNTADPQRGWRNEDGTVSRALDISQDGIALGSPHPKIFGGIENSFTYKNLDFNLGLTYALGFYVYNGSKAGLYDQRTWNNAKEVYENAWKKPGDITDIPKPVFGDNVSNGSAFVQSRNVEKGDFLKVRNISIGYNLKNNYLAGNLGISSLRIFAQVFNAFVITGYSGADPEISSNGSANLTPGVDRNTVPQARTYSFGLNVSF